MAITDGSPLDTDSLQRYGADGEHPLCIVPVIKEVNTLILDGVRAIRNRLKRHGQKGRQKRPGRPSTPVQHQRQHRNGMRTNEQATFLWDHQYLIVRKAEEMSAQAKDAQAGMVTSAPELTLFRQFTHQVYRLFDTGITQHCARYRRTRMVTHPQYHANPFLANALKTLRNDRFETMIVFLGGDNVERTQTHVERNTRGFRMLQKTRDQRRKTHTRENALDLEVSARMVDHPFSQQNIREGRPLSPEKSIQKIAA